MADPPNKSLADLTKALEPQHTELAKLSSQIEKLEQQRVLLKASAVAQLHGQLDTLGIPKEAIGTLVAGCL